MAERDVTRNGARAEIEHELVQMELECDVRVLLAIESGSRAWGFASPDSDYDVRCVYARPTRDYLVLEQRRDTIEWRLDKELDVVGWDLTKFLRLMRNSNPTVFEWLESPIVYRADPVFARVREVASRCYAPLASAHHYLGMARRNAHDHLRGKDVSLKKYLYVMRALLAVRWCAHNPVPVPMRFADLVAAELEPQLMPMVNKMLEQKSQTGEHAERCRIEPVDRWIEDAFEECEELVTDITKTPRVPWEGLDRVFQQVLG